MAFGDQKGPPASPRRVRELLDLLQSAGHDDFRDARGPMGFTQRQAAGKFTRDEADAFVAQLQEAEGTGEAPARAPRASAADEASTSARPSQSIGLWTRSIACSRTRPVIRSSLISSLRCMKRQMGRIARRSPAQPERRSPSANASPARLRTNSSPSAASRIRRCNMRPARSSSRVSGALRAGNISKHKHVCVLQLQTVDCENCAEIHRRRGRRSGVDSPRDNLRNGMSRMGPAMRHG